ncbi:hypothetical protein [Pueribacillus sp. YX66]|uniref:hypothetical protein n=1 Tax=Pueribacillus sp. YX66 TaxID=3229242 RepID=UPI00358D6B35
MGVNREHICKACDGTGMLSDDENWKYSCSVCDGEGVVMPGESTSPSAPLSVDEMNRYLD